MDFKDLKRITVKYPDTFNYLDNDVDTLLTAIDESLIKYIKTKIYKNTNLPEHIQKKLLEILKVSRQTIIKQYKITNELTN